MIGESEKSSGTNLVLTLELSLGICNSSTLK